VVAEFKAALVCDTNYAPALLNLAVVYDPAGPCKFGDIQSALDAYHRYLALTPPPPHAAEIGLMVTNMDKRERVMVQYPGQAPESPVTSGVPSTNKMTVIPKTNPPVRGPTPPPVTPPVPPPAAQNPEPTNLLIRPPPAPALAASNSHPIEPVIRPLPAPTPPPVAASASNHPPAAVPPVPRPPGPSPPRTDIAGSGSSTTAVPSRAVVSPVISNTAVATPSTATRTNIASASNTVPKPSLLARLLGRKPNPAATGVATNTGNPRYVTPLPAPADLQPTDSLVHPAAPPAPVAGPGSAAHYAPSAVNIEPGNRADAERLVKEGAGAEKESGFKAAVASYEKAVKADPSYYAACEALGMAAIKTDDYAVALEAFHHALVLDPDSPNARYDYAWALDKKEYYQDAANELEKLLARHPDETRAHLLLGNLYSQKLGQPDFARGHYRKVVEQDPGNGQAPALRAWLQNNPEP
jgi:TolA-binding protein